MFNRYILFFISALFLASCNDKKSKNIVLKLRNSDDKNIAFQDAYSKFPLRFFHKKYPLFYKSQISKHKNLPDKDFYMVFVYTDYNKFLYDLHSENLIDNEKYVDLARRSRLDSIIEQKKHRIHLLTAITGFTNGRQYLTVDTNQDYDFGDERTIFFDFDKEGPTTNIPEYTYKYDFITNEISEHFERKISIRPESEYYYFQHDDSIARKLGVTGKFKDYWEGSINVDTHSYDVAVQGYNSLYMNALIKHDSLKFSDRDAFYNLSFSYETKDTIRLSDKLFVLDSINSSFSKMYLRKLDLKSEEASSGWRIGEVVDDFRSEEHDV